MKTNKLTFAAGCESKEDPKTDPGTVEPGKPEPTPEPTPEKPKVKLLKRNGVEWKENTKINSYVGAKQYKVVWGDTLSLIARTWKVNCYRLARYNGIKNIDLIEVDQIIKNPAAK